MHLLFSNEIYFNFIYFIPYFAKQKSFALNKKDETHFKSRHFSDGKNRTTEFNQFLHRI